MQLIRTKKMRKIKDILKKIDKFFFNKHFQDIISRNTFGNFKLNRDFQTQLLFP